MINTQRLVQVLSHPWEIPSIVEWRTRNLRKNLRHFLLVRRTAYRLLHRMPSVEIDVLAPGAVETRDVILDHICLPPYYGSDEHDDVTPLLRIIKAWRPRVVLELGTAHGNTVANVCRFSEAQVYTVNALPEQLSGECITFALTRDEIGKVYRNYGYSDRVTQIYCDTLQFDPGQHFSQPCVDLAIIDACHDTDYVLNDFDKVLPTLKDRAIVLLHDTHPSMARHLDGSYRACTKLRRRGRDVRHIRGTWWAFWIKS